MDPQSPEPLSTPLSTTPHSVPLSAPPAYTPWFEPPGEPLVQETAEDRLNFTEAFLLSCVVFWCCGWIFGSLAFALAWIGQLQAIRGDVSSATISLKYSYVVSKAGLIIGLIAVFVYVAAIFLLQERHN